MSIAFNVCSVKISCFENALTVNGDDAYLLSGSPGCILCVDFSVSDLILDFLEHLFVWACRVHRVCVWVCVSVT